MFQHRHLKAITAMLRYHFEWRFKAGEAPSYEELCEIIANDLRNYTKNFNKAKFLIACKNEETPNTTK